MHDLLYNVKQIGEDVAVPKSPEPEGSPRLMTTAEIAKEHEVSRQTIHTYRRTGIFPSPVEGDGSTRPRFREDEVVAFFKANPKQPRKKRRPPTEQQGETVESTPEPRQAAEPAPLFHAIRAQSGDHLLKRFEDIEEAIEEQLPGLFDLPLTERGALIGALYVEAYRNEGVQE